MSSRSWHHKPDAESGNLISAYFAQVSDEELAAMIKEVNEWFDTAVLCQGLVREMTRDVFAPMLPMETGAILDLVARQIYAQGAQRFVQCQKITD